MNNAYEGLLHSFVRHFNDWNRFIDINDILKRLQPIRNRLDQIMRARNGNEALNFVQQLKSDIGSLPNDVWVGKQNGNENKFNFFHTKFHTKKQINRC